MAHSILHNFDNNWKKKKKLWGWKPRLSQKSSKEMSWLGLKRHQWKRIHMVEESQRWEGGPGPLSGCLSMSQALESTPKSLGSPWSMRGCDSTQGHEVGQEEANRRGSIPSNWDARKRGCGAAGSFWEGEICMAPKGWVRGASHSPVTGWARLWEMGLAGLASDNIQSLLPEGKPMNTPFPLFCRSAQEISGKLSHVRRLNCQRPWSQ